MKLRTKILSSGCIAALSLTSQCKLNENYMLEYAAALWSGSGQPLTQQNAPNRDYNPTDSDTAALPADFGAKGVEAYLFLSGFDNVDRYKSLQIRFSKNMNKAAVEAAFTFSNGDSNTAADTGPSTCGSGKQGNPCGEFHWDSARKVSFDPYVAMDSYSTFNITIGDEALSHDGEKLTEYTQDYRTEHAFLMNHKVLVSGEADSTTMNGLNDVTFDKSKGSLLLTTTFQDPSTDTLVTKVTMKKLGQTAEHVICDMTCNMTALGVTNLNLNSLASALRPNDGGNTYTYEITTQPSGKVYKRAFSFNYGMLKNNPDATINNAATVILDEPQGLPIISSIISRYILNEYKLTFDGSPLAFENFVNKDKINLDHGFSRYDKCAPPYDDSGYSNFHYDKACAWGLCKFGAFGDHNDVDNSVKSYNVQSVLRNFGDGSGTYKDGFCGANGPSGGFSADGGGLTGMMDIDIYVKQMHLPAYEGGQPATKATITTAANHELLIDIESRNMSLDLYAISRVRDWKPIMTDRDKITMQINSALKTSGYIQSRARTMLTVDNSGNSEIMVNTPYFPGNSGNTSTYYGGNNADDNFYIKGFVDNLATEADPDQYSSSVFSSIPGIANWIVGMVAAPLVETVLPQVTQGILKSFNEVVSPMILNGVISTMKDPGLTMPLPDYLPAPLANFPLNIKMQMAQSMSPGSDPIVRNDGTNKGLVFNAHISISKADDNGAWIPPAGGTRGHSKEQGMLITRSESDTSKLLSEKQKAFSKVGANPGILLQLRNDVISQASYQLWKNRVLDLTINKEFIDTIKAFMGSGPLLELTGDLVTAEPIISIMAPGRSSITVWDDSESDPARKSKKIFTNDYIDMVTDPIMAPSVQLVPLTSGAGVPNMRAYLTDMQITIKGKRCMNKGAAINDNTQVIDMYAKNVSQNYINLAKCKDPAQTQMVYYTVATSRISLNGTASFGFSGFDNKTGNPAFNNLSAIHVQIANDSSLAYSVDMLEGNAHNPMGLDPKAVYNILDPMITSLVVPLVNNILDQIPMPADVSFPAIVSNNTGQPCSMRMAYDSLRMKTVNSGVGDEFILGVGQLQGSYLSNPGNLISCP